MKFYICKHCGNIIAYVRSSGVPVVCCGEPMQEIIPGTTDGALEKHVPVIEVEGNKVTVRVGAVEHPMLPEHYIEWIALETAQGNQRKPLAPGQKPEAVFMLAEGDSVVPRTSTATCTACGRPEKLPFAARGSFRTPRHPKNVSRTGRYGARFLFPSLCFSPHVLAWARRQRARPHLWKRLKRAVKSCPVYSISWFRVLYWKSSGECISAARTYAGKGAFSE